MGKYKFRIGDPAYERNDKGKASKTSFTWVFVRQWHAFNPDEMKTAERYGFLFSNGMILTPNETKIMENIRVIH